MVRGKIYREMYGKLEILTEHLKLSYDKWFEGLSLARTY